MRKTLVLPVLLSALLAACSSNPADQGAAGVEDRNGQNSSVATVNADNMKSRGLAALRDPNSPLSKRDIYFDFDSFIIKPEFQSLIEQHAQFLLKNPDMKMLVQGNTDERGSREYNLALGQKRADAVKKALMLLGASEAQVESVSLGEEKPRCSTADEGCFAENRRGEILYAGEY